MNINESPWTFEGSIAEFTRRAEAPWSAAVQANMDGGYGEAVIRFAAKWANLMEARIATGADVATAAKETEREADSSDLGGITGFQYGIAISLLSSCWIHGEALRRWHNLATQIGNEGERANESGGVLNPALLNVSLPE